MRTLTKLIAALMVFGATAHAATRVTVTLTATNTAETGDGFTLNADFREFTNATAAATILTNLNSVAGTTTNFAEAVALYPFSGFVYSMTWSTATNVVFVGGIDETMEAEVTGDWGYVTHVTNTVTSGKGVRVPITIEPAAQQTNIASGLAEALSYATNIIDGVSISNATLSTSIAYDLLPRQFATGFWSIGTNYVTVEDSMAVGQSNYIVNPSSVYLGFGNREAAGDEAGYTIMIGHRNTASSISNAVVIGHGIAAEANTIILGDSSQKVSVPGGFKSATFHSVNLTGTNSIGGVKLIGFTNDIPSGTACTLDIRTNSIVWVIQDTTFEDATVVGISNNVPGMSVWIGNGADAYSASVNLYITNMSAAASAAAYKVKTPDGRDIVLQPGAIQQFVYDGGTAVWRPVGRPYDTALELLTLNAGTVNATNGSFQAGSVVTTLSNKVSGSFLISSSNITTVANGVNNISIAPHTTWLVLSGPTAAFSINGIEGSAAIQSGRVLYLQNNTAYEMTLAHLSGLEATAGFRLSNTGNGDIIIQAGGHAMLRHNGTYWMTTLTYSDGALYSALTVTNLYVAAPTNHTGMAVTALTSNIPPVLSPIGKFGQLSGAVSNYLAFSGAVADYTNVFSTLAPDGLLTNGFTGALSTAGYLTPDVSGYYRVSFSVQVWPEADHNGDETEAEVFLDSVAQERIVAHETLQTAIQTTYKGDGVVYIPAGTVVTLKIRNKSDSTCTLSTLRSLLYIGTP